MALRQIFDLYSCVRPCRYAGTPSPHKRPEDLDAVVYRENTADIYMGVEWEADDAVGQLRKHSTVVIPANELGKRGYQKFQHRHQAGEQQAASATSARRSSMRCASKGTSATSRWSTRATS